MLAFELTVDAIGNPEPITATVDCRRIRIHEIDNTTKLPIADHADKLYARDDTTGAKIQSGRVGGQESEFTARDGQAGFKSGDVMARIAVVSGSATFTVEQY